MNIDWQSQTYQQDFSYVGAYGEELLKLIDLKRVKTALDLGCGVGELTYRLHQLGLEVIGIDSSESQLKLAREHFPQLQFSLQQAQELRLEHKVDLVFSNAVLHWINKEDHPLVLARIHEVLTPQGEFIFECGGEGNNRLIHAALAQSFRALGHNYQLPFYFPKLTEYTELLQRCGFEIDSAYTFERPTPLQEHSGIKGFMQMFLQRPLDELTPEERLIVLKEVENALRAKLFHDGRWYADYVRLRVKAHAR